MKYNVIQYNTGEFPKINFVRTTHVKRSFQYCSVFIPMDINNFEVFSRNNFPIDSKNTGNITNSSFSTVVLLLRQIISYFSFSLLFHILLKMKKHLCNHVYRKIIFYSNFNAKFI